MKNICMFFLLLQTTVPAEIVNRLPGSPYPASTVPDTLFTVNSAAHSESELLTIATLQGLLARTQPKIYQIYNSGARNWLNDLQNNYVDTVDKRYENNYPELIKHFKDEIKGYVVCTPGNSSVNAAISLCGQTQSVAIAASQMDMFNAMGIPKTADVRNEDEEWFFENYGPSINKNILIYQKEDKYGFLSDYATFGGMITFFEPLTNSISRNIFRSMKAHSPVLGWGDSEFELVSQSSSNNMFVHPADWAKNLSTLSNFNVELKQKKHIKTADVEPNVHTVCFLFSDGDNIQWILNEFGTNSRWYASSNRNKVNLGWTLPPALAELAPTILKWIYDNADDTATGGDYFVAGPSGLGYMYPEKYRELDGYAELMDSFMEKGDFRIVNIIGNSDTDSYLSPFLKQKNTDALFFYFFSNYSGGAGRVKWVEGKPVIYARHNFWEGFESISSLASKLNKASRDIYSSRGYSLIPVHNWTRSVNDVISCINLLNDDVRVVAPDEFVALIKQNLKPVSSILEFLPTNNAVELKYLMPEYAGTGYNNVSRWADGYDEIIYKFFKDSLLALSGGQDDLRLKFTASNEYVISIASALDDEYHVVQKWSDTNEHVHDHSNRARLFVDIHQYLDPGWQELYVKFEDGIKSDGWGAFLTHFQIFKSDLPTSVKYDKSEAPTGFELYQNYPNPFNPSTTIAYTLDKPGDVRLAIYDMLGRQIRTLVASYQHAGYHNIPWDGLNEAGLQVPAGIYFYQLLSGAGQRTKKMVVTQ